VFELLIAALVHGSSYERIATEHCSDRTIRRRRRRRLRLWAEAGLGEQLHELALDAYDRMIGLDLADVSADGAITKAPCGGDRAGRSPVDRGKGGMKRSTGVDGYGIPLADPGATVDTLRSACRELLALGRQQEHLIDALLTLAGGYQPIDRWERFELAGLTGWRPAHHRRLRTRSVAAVTRHRARAVRASAASAAPAGAASRSGGCRAAERPVSDSRVRRHLPGR
jgi:hypothetical protein